MKEFLKKLNLWLTASGFGISLFIPLVLLSLFFSIGGEPISRILFNADILYFPVLYKDIFIDGYHLDGWNIPGAPNFFPDMLVYFFLMYLSNSVPVSMFLFAFFQLLTILLLFKYIVKLAFPEISLYPVMLGNLLLSLFFMVTFIDNEPYISFHLVSNTYHLGTFVNALIALLLALRFLITGKPIYLIVFALLGTLAFVSDRLFIILFCLPFTGAILLFVRKKENFRKLLSLAIALFVIVAAGLIIFDRITHNHTIHLAKAYFDINLNGITNSWKSLFYNLSVYFSDFKIFTLIICISILGLAISIYMLIRSFREIWKGFLIKDGLPEMMNTFFVLFMLIVFFTPVFTGSFQGFDTIRYNIFVFYLGLMFFGVLLVKLFHQNPMIKKAVKVSSLLLSLILTIYIGIYLVRNKPVTGVKEFFAYYPEISQCIDSMDVKYELKHGLTTYWLGKPGTLFSKRDVRLYTVYDENLVPYSHVGNENWYYETGYGKYDPPLFNFLILQLPLSENSLETIKNRVGEIIAMEEYGKFIFLLCNDFKYSRQNHFPELLENTAEITEIPAQ